MSLKQKLAEKERLAQEKVRLFHSRLTCREHPLTSQLLNGDDDDELIPTMTEQDRRRMARERELEADLDAANDLFADINVNSELTFSKPYELLHPTVTSPQHILAISIHHPNARIRNGDPGEWHKYPKSRNDLHHQTENKGRFQRTGQIDRDRSNRSTRLQPPLCFFCRIIVKRAL